MFLKIVTFILILVTVLFLLAKYIEARAVFFPDKTVRYTPEVLPLNYRDVFIKQDSSTTICGWYIPCSGAEYTVLLFHGNAGNIGDRIDKIAYLNSIGLNLFIIDYRGYGASSGNPTVSGVYADAKAAYDYLITEEKIPASKIIIFGVSLGGAVAVNLAAEVSGYGGLILEGAFSSGRDMGKRIYPYVPTWFFSNKLNSIGKIEKVTAPKLFIHSRQDQIVPFDLAEKLFNKAVNPKRFVEIDGGHCDGFIVSKSRYLSAISEFVESLNRE
ncbi:MAG: alpha/beta hydrolase [Candidatus Omnitrophica bacterium]|nr:alpha/beta hydrolase [Candidatus Omnitrophota bacterium]